MEDQDRSRLQGSGFQRDLYDVSDISLFLLFAMFFRFNKRKHAVSRFLMDESIMFNILRSLTSFNDRLYIFIGLVAFSTWQRVQVWGCPLFRWIGRISFKSLEDNAIVFWGKLDIDGWAFEMLILCSRDVDEDDEKKRLVVTIWNRDRTSR